MPDFKLISADGHVNEPPMAWERAQSEYGERAPRVVKDPPGVPAGTWLITDGLVPIGVSHFSTGLVISRYGACRYNRRGKRWLYKIHNAAAMRCSCLAPRPAKVSRECSISRWSSERGSAPGFD